MAQQTIITGRMTNHEGQEIVLTKTINVPDDEAVAELTLPPVAPYPLPIPAKTTMAALRDRVDYLTSVLVEAGLIAQPQDRPTEADPRMTALLEAPVTAPEAPDAQTPAPVAAEAVAAGVVDGA